MRKILTICIFTTLTCGISAAQKVSVVLHTGAGTFRMTTQKELQEDFRGNVLPWRPVHKFPPYWIYGGSLSFHFNPRVGASAYFEYGSTGGTLHYSDYSGSAQFNQYLRYAQWGVGTFVQINRSEKWPLFATFQILRARTKENLAYTIKVGNVKEEDSENFRSTNIGLRPGVMMQRRLNKVLFQANFGMEMQFPGRLENNAGTSLVLENGDNVYAQWSGLRASLGVGLMVGRKKDAAN